MRSIKTEKKNVMLCYNTLHQTLNTWSLESNIIVKIPTRPCETWTKKELLRCKFLGHLHIFYFTSIET